MLSIRRDREFLTHELLNPTTIGIVHAQHETAFKQLHYKVGMVDAVASTPLVGICIETLDRRRFWCHTQKVDAELPTVFVYGLGPNVVGCSV